jgi:hypothetical protein
MAFSGYKSQRKAMTEGREEEKKNREEDRKKIQ